jgi:hypothetical protein
MCFSVFYEGQEKDKYDTYFGAVKTTFRQLHFYVEIYRFRFHTLEQEHFDISAQYRLGK